MFTAEIEAKGLKKSGPKHWIDAFGINILSLDGGGIYGLTEALLLRQLCEECEWFLGGEDVQVFAGCSAGALNALLLASYEKPREAVLAGKLEDFWSELGTFSNSDPWKASLSYYGLTPWFSDKDFLWLLSKYFGDCRLKDLKHNVVISAYNWTGETPDFTEAQLPLPWPFSLVTPGAHATPHLGARHWRPICFLNFPQQQQGSSHSALTKDPDFIGHEYKIVDIAYAAAAPPGLRRIRGGVGDGGTANANPALCALGLTRKFIDCVRRYGHVEAEIRGAVLRRGGTAEEVDRVFQAYHDASSESGWSLEKICVLALGSGQTQPSYFLRDIDVGTTLFNAMPTNPSLGAFFPPSAYGLDPAADDADAIASHLLTHHFHRLDPPVMALPTLAAVGVSRFPWLLHQVVVQIKSAVRSPATRSSVNNALKFLQDEWRLPQPVADYIKELEGSTETRGLGEAQDQLRLLFAAVAEVNPEAATRVFERMTSDLGISASDRLFGQARFFERDDAAELAHVALKAFARENVAAQIEVAVAKGPFDRTLSGKLGASVLFGEDWKILAPWIRASVVTRPDDAARVFSQAYASVAGTPIWRVYGTISKNIEISPASRRILEAICASAQEGSKWKELREKAILESLVERLLSGNTVEATLMIQRDPVLRGALGGALPEKNQRQSKAQRVT